MALPEVRRGRGDRKRSGRTCDMIGALRCSRAGCPVFSRRRARPALVRRVVSLRAPTRRAARSRPAPPCRTAPTGARRRAYRRAPRLARRPRCAASASPCPCAAAPQELAKQADPNLTLDNEAQQARGQLGSQRARACGCAACVLTRAHPADASQVMQDIAEDFVENVAAFACELVTLTLTPALAVAVARSPNRARRRIRVRAGQAPRSHPNPSPSPRHPP